MSETYRDEPMEIEEGPPQRFSAGFWRRAVALVIDLALIFVTLKIIQLVEIPIYNRILSGTILDAGGETFARIQGWFDFANLLIGTFLPLLYFTLMERSRRGATFGKRLLGVRIINNRFEKIGFFHSLWRNLSKSISLALFFLGFLLAAFLPGKRALHDLLSGTRAVLTRIVPPE